MKLYSLGCRLVASLCLRPAVWALGVAAGASALASANPPMPETRVFRILVDDKPAGEYRMTIRQQDNNFSFQGHADVQVHYLVFNYVYFFQGTEEWHGNRLQNMETTARDDGKQFNVKVKAEGNVLRVTDNGHELKIKNDVWTTTYWRLPAAAHRNKTVTLLDADTGKEISATLRLDGMQERRVDGRMVPCSHWRVTGGVNVELWYDNAERLVRQESKEAGHRTTWELVRTER